MKLKEYAIVPSNIFLSSLAFAHFAPTDGNGGGIDPNPTSTSGGIFTQTLSSTLSTVTSSITVSSCLSTDVIYCQINIFDNTAQTVIGAYQTWGNCSSGSATLTTSSSIACVTNDSMLLAVFCTDTTKGFNLTASGSNQVSVTCV